MNEADREQAAARFRARLELLPPPDDATIGRIAALFAAIRLRASRDRARANSETPPPLSHPDNEGRNVRPSAPVSGVGN